MNRTDEEGQRVWDGAPDPAMEAAATLPVQELLWTRTDVFAGAALTSDGTMLEIFVTDDGAEVVDQARDLLGAEFDAYVRVAPVEHSWDELTAAQDAVFAGDGAEGLGIISAGIDIVGNHLDVGIDVEMDGERIAAAHPEGITASTPRTTPLERHLVPIAAEHDVLIDLRAEEMAVAA
ncbi:hypothetical protein [Brachybacterium phenoliresistens]|uniref:hypothetical protein n=1 Tax=Brachybacterium phenoliresistens TaxID=396014 RepID=UPI0012EB255D|nr:hypothetical protein [Brachybacterium phenoliresistens]